MLATPKYRLGRLFKKSLGISSSQQTLLGRQGTTKEVEKEWNNGKYIKKFNSYLLDIKNMLEDDKLYNFIIGFQLWVQDLHAAATKYSCMYKMN